jgi:hypothetical protein
MAQPGRLLDACRFLLHGGPISSSRGTDGSNPTPGSLNASETAKDSAILGEGTRGVLSQMERAEDKGWSDVLQVNRRDPRKSFIRTVAQRRPAGWLTRGEGACGNYLFGQARKDVHAGCG